jgi:hypothetical protein
LALSVLDQRPIDALDVLDARGVNHACDLPVGTNWIFFDADTASIWAWCLTRSEQIEVEQNGGDEKHEPPGANSNQRGPPWNATPTHDAESDGGKHEGEHHSVFLLLSGASQPSMLMTDGARVLGKITSESRLKKYRNSAAK